jgi:hypothetical protein
MSRDEETTVCTLFRMCLLNRRSRRGLPVRSHPATDSARLVLRCSATGEAFQTQQQQRLPMRRVKTSLFTGELLQSVWRCTSKIHGMFRWINLDDMWTCAACSCRYFSPTTTRICFNAHRSSESFNAACIDGKLNGFFAMLQHRTTFIAQFNVTDSR